MNGPRPPASPYFVLLAAVAFISVGSILVRLAQAPGLAVAFYRIAFAALIVAPFALRSATRSVPLASRRQGLLLAASGVALALHFAAWTVSLSHTSIASSVLLVNTAPLFAVVLARVFLGERVSGTLAGAIALAFVGAVLIAAADFGRAPTSLRGNLLALVGALTLAIHHVVGRGLRKALPLDAYVLSIWSLAALVLSGIAAATGTRMGPYPVRTWLAFLALGLVPTVLGHGLVNRALRSLPAPTVGLFLLGEPVGASILAFLIFGERPAASAVAGGLVVLAALALAAGARDD